MFNFLKPRQPQVTWWSSIKNLEKICPPVRSSHFVPKWFKEIEPCEYKDASNIKLCPSFMQYFSTGWVIPLWCDLQIGMNAVGKIFWEAPHTDFRFEFHHDAKIMPNTASVKPSSAPKRMWKPLPPDTLRSARGCVGPRCADSGACRWRTSDDVHDTRVADAHGWGRFAVLRDCAYTQELRTCADECGCCGSGSSDG